MKLLFYLIKPDVSAVTLLAFPDNGYDIGRQRQSIAQLHSGLCICFQTKGEKGGYC